MKLYSVGEVSELLKISERAVHSLVRQGKLGCIEITNRRRRFTEEHIREFLAASTRTPRTPKKVDSVSPTLLDYKAMEQIKRGGDPGLTGGSAKAALREEMRQWR